MVTLRQAGVNQKNRGPSLSRRARARVSGFFGGPRHAQCAALESWAAGFAGSGDTGTGLGVGVIVGAVVEEGSKLSVVGFDARAEADLCFGVLAETFTARIV